MNPIPLNRLDERRLVACLAAPLAGGSPSAASQIRTRLAALSLVETARAVIEIVVPKAGRYPLRLAVEAPQDATFSLHVSQRTPSRGITGGAALVLTADRRSNG